MLKPLCVQLCVIAVGASFAVAHAQDSSKTPGRDDQGRSAKVERASDKGRKRGRSLVAAEDSQLDVVYKRVGQRELQLDLYYPPGNEASTETDRPLVIYTHGGGWSAGSRQGIHRGSFRDVFQRLLSHGFAVATVDYRLCKKESAVTMRDCVVDCKDACRYLAKHSQKLKLDPARFFVMGDSAGGQIAQMLLLSAPQTLAGDAALATSHYRMVCGVSWYGPCDFEKTELFNHDDRADFRDRFGPRILGPGVPDPEIKLQRYREMSPVNYLATESSPLLMVQGDKDTTIPVKHAYFMKQKAEAIGAPVEILIVKNSGHNWRRVDADIHPTRDEIVQRTVQFFVDHLKD